VQALAITGFLGTGKTTLTLALATALADRGARVAIIENERGGIGVDGAYLEAHGLTVREIRAGCVCCELVLPLRRTVEALRDGFQPDWMLLEASGVANADSLRASLEQPRIGDQAWTFLALIDAARFTKLWHERYGLGTLIRPQVAQADLLVLTKVDAVGRRQAALVLRDLQRLRPEIATVAFAADHPGATTALLRALKVDDR
jgi:G3E family GTPase